jgi:hypothetical protein
VFGNDPMVNLWDLNQKPGAGCSQYGFIVPYFFIGDLYLQIQKVMSFLTDCQPFFFGLIFAEDQLSLHNLKFQKR